MKKQFLFVLLIIGNFYVYGPLLGCTNFWKCIFPDKKNSYQIIPDNTSSEDELKISLPEELWYKIFGYMGKKGCTLRNLNKELYDIYNRYNKKLYEKIASKKAQKYLEFVAGTHYHVKPLKEMYASNKKKFGKIYDKVLKKKFEDDYERYIRENFDRVHIKLGLVFLNEEIRKGKVTRVDELDGYLHKEDFKSSKYKEMTNISTPITIFYYKNKPTVLIFPKFSMPKSTDEQEFFLKEVVSQYPAVQRIIINRFYLERNWYNVLTSLETSCRVLSNSNIILQQNSGFTFLHYYVKKQEKTMEDKKKFKEIKNKYSPYCEALLDIPDYHGGYTARQCLKKQALRT